MPSWAVDALAILLMFAGVLAVYWSPIPPGGSQLASDFYGLHQRRMIFAREALLGPDHTLPAWYPREALGTPFWSNIQNFPFIPTRLLLLLAFDPKGPYTFTFGITLAAMLGALFTYLYARRIGLHPVASAAAGWTFVACGYFAARVAAGHLPMLEAYAALPLLLWGAESLIQAREAGRPQGRWILALGISTTCIMLAGHPQLSIYALGAASLYALWRVGIRRAIVPLASMALGVGCAAFALLPMFLLIGRSTRILPLDRAGNDLALPYRRLLGFFLPWLDGAAMPLPRANTRLFTYPDAAIFWDTFCYAGWTPWIAVLFLAVVLIRKRVRLAGVALFLLALGVAGIVLALPIVQQISSFIPGTLLRSPARLLYFTEFALAMGLAGAVHMMLLPQWRKWGIAAAAIALTVHAIDLGRVGREFDLRDEGIDTRPWEHAIAPALASVGDGRIAMDINALLDSNRRYDDVGFFDSIILARSYSLLMDLTLASPTLNEQAVNGSLFSKRTLEVTGVKFVFKLGKRDDLELIGPLEPLYAYVIRNPARRAAFFPLSQTLFVEENRLRSAIRDGVVDLSRHLLIPRSHMPHVQQVDVSPDPPQVSYTRASSDRIECSVATSQYGYLRIIESWDPGWSVTVNGEPAKTVPALGALLAVELPPGRYQVVFTYRTPGAAAGIALAIVSLVGLIALGWMLRSRRATPAPSVPSAAEH